MTTAVGKQERTFQVLRKRIIDGTYASGHRLVIAALARELNVSEMPVREAIRRLEAEGWVSYQRNFGAQVTPIDGEAWVSAMGTFAILEGYATSLSAPLITSDDLGRMREINAEMGDALEEFDMMSLSEHNQAFHAVIYDRCPNPHLRDELAATQERLNTLRSTIFAFIPSRGKVSLVEHENLLRLIEAAGDPLEVELAAREHKMHTVSAYRQRLDERKP